jgi:DNA-directed RNA polymerase subunit RPC12/RpoP
MRDAKRLIKCSQCGEIVSFDFKVCPHCGKVFKVLLKKRKPQTGNPPKSVSQKNTAKKSIPKKINLKIKKLKNVDFKPSETFSQRLNKWWNHLLAALPTIGLSLLFFYGTTSNVNQKGEPINWWSSFFVSLMFSFGVQTIFSVFNLYPKLYFKNRGLAFINFLRYFGISLIFVSIPFAYNGRHFLNGTFVLLIFLSAGRALFGEAMTPDIPFGTRFKIGLKGVVGTLIFFLVFSVILTAMGLTPG